MSKKEKDIDRVEDYFYSISLQDDFKIEEQIQKRVRIKSGKLHGLQEEWYPHGEKMWETPYKNGNLHGLQKKYNQHGDLIQEIPFKEGIRHGKAKWYNSKGRLIQECFFVEGKLDGEAKCWYDGSVQIKKTPPSFSQDVEKVLEDWENIKTEPSGLKYHVWWNVGNILKQKNWNIHGNLSREVIFIENEYLKDDFVIERYESGFINNIYKLGRVPTNRGNFGPQSVRRIIWDISFPDNYLDIPIEKIEEKKLSAFANVK